MNKIDLSAAEELEPNDIDDDVIAQRLITLFPSSGLSEKIKQFQSKLKADDHVYEQLEQLTPLKFAQKVKQLESWAYALSLKEENEIKEKNVEDIVEQALNLVAKRSTADSPETKSTTIIDPTVYK